MRPLPLFQARQRVQSPGGAATPYTAIHIEHWTESVYTPLEDRIKRKMPHTLKEKQKILNRLRRIRGQLDAVERALTQDAGCAAVLQQATACRGALDGLIAEVVEGHIREHVIDPRASADDPRAQSAEELIEIVHSFLT